MHRVGQDGGLVGRQPPPVHPHLPEEVGGIVGKYLTGGPLLEGACAGIKFPARLFGNTSQFLLSGGAILCPSSLYE